MFIDLYYLLLITKSADLCPFCEELGVSRLVDDHLPLALTEVNDVIVSEINEVMTAEASELITEVALLLSNESTDENTTESVQNNSSSPDVAEEIDLESPVDTIDIQWIDAAIPTTAAKAISVCIHGRQRCRCKDCGYYTICTKYMTTPSHILQVTK